MGRRQWMVAGLMSALVLGGCAGQGQTVATQSGGAEPVMSRAPQSGTYALYTSSLSLSPKLTVHLIEGEQLGFERTPDGRTRAVGGDRAVELSGKSPHAYWQLKKGDS